MRPYCVLPTLLCSARPCFGRWRGLPASKCNPCGGIPTGAKSHPPIRAVDQFHPSRCRNVGLRRIHLQLNERSWSRDPWPRKPRLTRQTLQSIKAQTQNSSDHADPVGSSQMSGCLPQFGRKAASAGLALTPCIELGLEEGEIRAGKRRRCHVCPKTCLTRSTSVPHACRKDTLNALES